MPVPVITPAEVQAVIAGGRAVDLIDVRTASEFAAVHAVGARHVPLSGLDPAAVMAARRAPEGDPLYLICASGGRSAAAAQAFIDAGFANVRSVAGGTGAWAAAGLPVERRAGAAALGVVRQLAIYLAVFAGIMLLMPCSPWSLWGAAWCPVTKASPGGPAAVTPAAAGFDFARDVVEASRRRPVVVDFSATWCGPCTMLAPELEAVAQERKSSVAFVSIDVDQHREAAAAQDVDGIPAVRLWRDGREVARFTGYRSRDEVAAWLDAAPASAAP